MSRSPDGRILQGEDPVRFTVGDEVETKCPACGHDTARVVGLKKKGLRLRCAECGEGWEE